MTDIPPSSGSPSPNRLSWPGAFAVAWNGIWYALRTQRSMRVHVVATVCVVAAGCWFRVSAIEWCILAVVVGLVGTAELLNTAIEVVVDELCPQRNRHAGLAKDLASGGVLWASIFAIGVGLVIFGPRLWGLVFGNS